MADAAIENVLLTNLKAYVIATDTARFNRSNVQVVPFFDKPPQHYTDILIQIKYPDLYPYGQAGGCYLTRIVFDIAVFKRQQRDPKKEWESILTDLNEAALIVRQRLNNYNGGSVGSVANPSGAYLPLPIHLFDSHQTMSPRILQNDKGEYVKDVAWTAFRMWGLAAASSVTRFKSPSTPS